MALFEHVVLLKQDLSSSDLESEIKNHEEMISELNGSIVSKESWGLRNLAYPINNNKKAFYELMNIDIPNENIKKISQKLNLNENVIRYITVKVNHFEDGPSPMIKGSEWWNNSLIVTLLIVLTIKILHHSKNIFLRKVKLLQEELAIFQ